MKLFWLDLEMTGLEPQGDRILEAAYIITDSSFKELETGEQIVFQPPEILEKMNDWCQVHHRESGLLEKVPHGILEEELDQKLEEAVQRYFSKEEPAYLAGNSIWQDRRFVERWLPRFAQSLHYRMLDVSTLKLIFQGMHGVSFPKSQKHRALEDIRESIAEFQYYQSMIVVKR